jgi:hypothetical protein
LTDVTGLIEMMTGLPERRLLRTAWIPVLSFCAALSVVVCTGVGWSESVDRWQALPVDLRVLALFAFLTTTLLLAQVLTAVRPGLVRLYEGHWDGLPYGTRLAERLAPRHEDQAVRVARPWSLPVPGELLPTRLGNTLRAAEQEAMRYGVDAATAWPRLYVVLPDAFTRSYAEAAVALESMITVSALGAVFAVTGGVYALLLLPLSAALAIVLIGLFVSWAGGRAATLAAVPYGELIRAAFDVHRWLLIDAMGLERPTSLAEERQQWKQIHQIWQRGRPDSDAEHLLRYPGRTLPPPGTSPALSSTPSVPPAPRIGVGRFVLRYKALGSATVVSALLVFFLHSAVGPGEQPTATRVLVAFRPIGAGDISGARKDLVGRYPLQNIPQGQPVDISRLGPRLAPGALGGKVVTSLHVAADGMPTARGDRVVLIATPAKAGPRTVENVIVLDTRPGNRLVVALQRPELIRLLDREPVIHVASPDRR